MSSQSKIAEEFRVDDVMQIYIANIDPDRLEGILSDFESFRMQYYSLVSFIKLRNERLSPTLTLIRRREPEVAQYLEHLEGLIQLIASRMPTDEDSKSNSRYQRNSMETAVSVSRKSIRFDTDQALVEGQVVELGMKLSTSGQEVLIIATVSSVEEEPIIGDLSPDTKGVSLQFTHVHEDDREAIIMHMATLQRQELEARRKS